MGVLLFLAAPEFVHWRQRQRLRAAGWHLAITGLGLRVAAAADGRARGIVFGSGSDPGWTVVADGDSDGIRSADVASGTDPQLGAAERLLVEFPGVSYGLPLGTRDLDGRGDTRAIRFGRSGILVLSPDGGSSTGTAYLRNDFDDALAVRVYGPTGRLSIWEKAAAERAWSRVW